MRIKSRWRIVAGLLAAAMLVTSCAGADGGEADKKLVFAGLGGSFETGLKKTLIPAFEKKYGVKVEYVSGTTDQLMAKVRAGKRRQNVDVIWNNDATHYAGKKEGLFEKLDTGTVTNLSQVYPFAKDPDGVGVVQGIQAVGLEYQTKVFKEHGWKAPKSWKDMWNPKYKGYTSGYNIPTGYANIFLALAADLDGGSVKNLEPGWKRLKRLDGKIASSPAQLTELFSQREVWISYDGSARAYEAKRRGMDVEFVYPSEGGVSYPQWFDVVKDAPHSELAQKFVNMMLDPGIQADIAKETLLGPVNKQAKVSKDVAAVVPYGASEVAKLDQLDLTPMYENLPALTDRWTKLAGGHS